MRPRVGLTADREIDRNRHTLMGAYSEAVWAAGGLPLVLPVLADSACIEEWCQAVDAVVLTGGDDPDPALFGEEPLPGLGRIVPERDRLEVALARRALETGLPLLAICRGLQVMNVALGGDLYQDLGRQVPAARLHFQNAPRNYPFHRVDLDPGTVTAAILATNTLRVNSFHHQAVRTPAPGLVVAARAGDGIIEGLEHPGHRFFLGVQWHPETMALERSEQARLFLSLVQAAGGA